MKGRLSRALGMVLTMAILAGCSAAGTGPTAGDTGPPLTATPARASTIPPGTIRPAVVAGSWYPGDPDQLASEVDGMLEAVTPVDGAPMALIVPHAGYVYSGPVAAAGFRQLEQGTYDVAVVLASDHRPPLARPIAVWVDGGFETPLGVVPVDAELAQALVEAHPSIVADRAAHEAEHPIEIELPFLQRVCPDCAIVPVMMGADDQEAVRVLADALLATLPGRRALLVASSDLSHYPSLQDAQRVDGTTLSAIETMDPGLVRDTVTAAAAAGVPNLVTCACGLGPILVTVRVAEGLGADTVTLLRYATSADAGGDPGQVVGYGVVMFWRYQPPHLSPAQRDQLLMLARESIAASLASDALPVFETDEPALTRPSAVFVTLRKDGALRGCIGRTWADLPLHQAVQRMAVTAATEDPRFPALTADELSQVTIEVSVLSPRRRVIDPTEIEVGTHGLIVAASGRSGLLLPQVAVEQGWDRERFLENACQKAGLPPRCWHSDVQLYTFTAIVFGEE
jgi:hypothetical protein